MLLSVYQNNLAASGGGGSANFGTASSQQPKQQPTPQRTLTEFVTGRGFFVPEMTTTATQPFLGTAGSTPQYPYVLAVDQTAGVDLSVNLGPITSGTTLDTTFSIDLPVLALDPTDNATLLLVPNVYFNPAVVGLTITSVELEPEALTPNGWVSARVLQGGQTYSSWRVHAKIGVYNLLSLLASGQALSGTVHAGVQALLTVLPQ